MTKIYRYTILENTSNRLVQKYQTKQGAKNWIRKQNKKEDYRIVKEIS